MPKADTHVVLLWSSEKIIEGSILCSTPNRKLARIGKNERTAIFISSRTTRTTRTRSCARARLVTRHFAALIFVSIVSQSSFCASIPSSLSYCYGPAWRGPRPPVPSRGDVKFELLPVSDWDRATATRHTDNLRPRRLPVKRREAGRPGLALASHRHCQAGTVTGKVHHVCSGLQSRLSGSAWAGSVARISNQCRQLSQRTSTLVRV